MDASVIKSYLVALGFEVDEKTYRAFEKSLADSERTVHKFTKGMGKDMLRVGAEITAMYAALTGGTVALIDKVAQADLGYKLYATRMYMSADAAKRLQMATDALGHSLDEIAWNPELRERFVQLEKDQMRMQGGLGRDFGGQMKTVRDIRFEITRLRLEVNYLGQSLAVNLMRAFGGDEEKVLGRLRNFNDWLMSSLPKLGKELSTEMAPVLKDIVELAKALGENIHNLTSLYIRFTGELANDAGLKSGAVTIKNFAHASELWLKALTDILKALAKLSAWFTSHPELARIAAGGYIGAQFGGPVGAVLGAGAGAGYSVYQDTKSLWSSHSTVSEAKVGNRWLLAQQAAQEASRATGIPANIIFGQWAHETGGFSNRGATSLNNLAGIRVPGGDYRSYSSYMDFERDWVSNIMRNYKGALGAKTSAEFAEALKHGRLGAWYEDSQANYTAGIERWQGRYSAPSITMGDINVNVNNPMASAHEVATEVRREVAREMDKRTQKNLATMGGPYGN